MLNFISLYAYYCYYFRQTVISQLILSNLDKTVFPTRSAKTIGYPYVDIKMNFYLNIYLLKINLKWIVKVYVVSITIQITQGIIGENSVISANRYFSGKTYMSKS